MAQQDSRQEALYRTVVKGSPDPIITMNTRKEILCFNPAAERVFGYTEQEVLGKNVSMLMPEPHRSAHDGYVDRYLSTGQKRVIGFYRELVGRRKDGSTFPLELSVMEDRVGDTRLFTGFTRDLSQQKKVQAELEQANRAKSMFMASMSHEFRTYMNAILGFNQLLQRRVTDATSMDYLRIIQTSGASLLGLINDVLDMSKLEAGQIELQPEPGALAAILDDVSMTFQQEAARKGITLRARLDASVPGGVLIDALRLKQVLVNLVSNAIKFTEAGGVSVEASAAPAADHEDAVDLRLSVKDTGIGIKQDQLERIFSAFAQAEDQSQEQFGGTGLGLAISKDFVKLMGGRITASSEVGRGSCFDVHIPAVPVTAPLAVEEPGVTTPEPPHLDFSGARVLVADDLLDNRRLLQGMLAPYNVLVSEAHNGQEVLDGVALDRPDIILLDLQMPVMGGEEALARLKGDPATRQIPVVVITASISRAQEPAVRDLCDHFLRKPVQEDELLQAMSRHLAHQPRRLAQPSAEQQAITAEPELLEALGPIIGKARRLARELDMDEVEDLAAELKRVAKALQVGWLESIAMDLAERAADFDVGGVPALLDRIGALR